MLQTLLIVACMWLSSYFGGLERVPQHSMPLNARSTSSNISQGSDSMDLVVSRYDESANSIASYIGPILNIAPLSGPTTRVIIYSTGQDEPENFATTYDITYASTWMSSSDSVPMSVENVLPFCTTSRQGGRISLTILFSCKLSYATHGALGGGYKTTLFSTLAFFPFRMSKSTVRLGINVGTIPPGQRVRTF